MNPCPLRLDTPPVILADWLHEHAWTVADVLHWQQAVLDAFLRAGGWDMLPEGVLVEQASLGAAEWEFELPNDG
jgi:hypothetical protein